MLHNSCDFGGSTLISSATAAHRPPAHFELLGSNARLCRPIHRCHACLGVPTRAKSFPSRRYGILNTARVAPQIPRARPQSSQLSNAAQSRKSTMSAFAFARLQVDWNLSTFLQQASSALVRARRVEARASTSMDNPDNCENPPAVTTRSQSPTRRPWVAPALSRLDVRETLGGPGFDDEGSNSKLGS